MGAPRWRATWPRPASSSPSSTSTDGEPARPRKTSARTAGSAAYAACATNATGILAAGGVMALLPAILVFLLLQRIIGGTLTSGALKG